MKVSILSVGTEILLGQIANTNAQFISKVLNELGASVVRHVAVGDNPERLERTFKEELFNHDVVILTGGLGPTKDDLTKQTVAQVLERGLETNQQAMDHIERYFKNENRTMTPNNKQQALVIEGSDVLNNDVGMAPGMYLELDDKKIVLLPGPPKELQPMVNQYLIPYFLNEARVIFSESLKFTGIGESSLETELMDIIDNQTNPTIAPLAGQHEVSLRITANTETKQKALELIKPVKEEILSRIGKYYYGSDDLSIEEAVFNELDQPFVIYDGITDGVLYSRLKLSEKSEEYLKAYTVKNDWSDSVLNIAQNDTSEEITKKLKEVFKVESTILLLQDDKESTVYISHKQKNKKFISSLSQSYAGRRDRISNIALIEYLNLLR
ncbi:MULTISPECIES: CinA family nicotinamide mononucleotide deamidase-related protein [Mammaliicoccus]|uniref:CinA family nicotinamide mononucleotide deamidase-related protein n=1 Tax=Mammaliicoccus TaxID=2803850 RepID=UPI000E088749|nr:MULTISPECIES: CinA family nicotinamide mononucleotide deamidase-related protein [Mammaliicoccus]HCN59596.1 competence/damage-inducible protein A [Staphylococcus sp.]MBO3062782.1 CinA family nicotinamide mononucleotide deamidase-related protein [Mammaliicoccus fleurettii]MEB7723445.1 CinA family nicotinamide mononucleotide deamidase-related protein [Mammaliicoccus fleurettii]MEB7805566.1 CinA family nicotinamide mononucleotide deamidase-related protein [Mammaliicoccus fleurettii]MEB8067258.1